MSAESDSVTVTGSRIPSPDTPGTSPVVTGPPPQAGLLTAGDYDDLLNPVMYRDFTSNFLQTRRDYPLRPIDTANAVTVRVTGRGGRPLPFAWVEVDRPNREPLVLSTGADGVAMLFLAYDGLAQSTRLTVREPTGQGVSSVIGLNLGQLSADRVVPVRLDVAAEQPRQLDLALVIDATGSMSDELRYIQTELRSIVDWLSRSLPGVDVRIGLVVYRDRGDEYVTRTFALTGDIAALQRDLAAQSADGGGDWPEAMHTALREAYDLDWRRDAVRVAMLVADAPPHTEDLAATWAVANDAREGRIHILPVAASGVAEDAEYVMRGMAALTDSRYLFLTDDSGVGLPHEAPTVKCYQVTRLDSLIRRVIAGFVTGERVEADPQEVIRTVGNYDRGVCRTPQ